MERVQRVIEKMKKQGFTQILITDPDSIWYLTGIFVEPYERMYAMLLKDTGDQTLFLNDLFFVPETEIEKVWFSDTDDCVGKLAEKIDPTKILGVDKAWSARYLIPLIERFDGLKVALSSDCVDDCRAVKDEEEIRKMKKASEINDSVIEKAASYVKVGMKEKDVADFIHQCYLEEGASGESFNTIVSFGKNAADPHHEPDDTVLEEGMCVLIDMGCVYDKYCSDMTRTYFCGNPSERQQKIHEIVRKANENAEKAIRPGVKLKDIDAIARDYITKAGYGTAFNHRLGHFIGQRDHEMGDVSATSEIIAEPGMIFSIEPGIYLKDDFGVRIEDLVLVTEDGCEVLNRVDKNWKLVG